MALPTSAPVGVGDGHLGALDEHPLAVLVLVAQRGLDGFAALGGRCGPRTRSAEEAGDGYGHGEDHQHCSARCARTQRGSLHVKGVTVPRCDTTDLD